MSKKAIPAGAVVRGTDKGYVHGDIPLAPGQERPVEHRKAGALHDAPADVDGQRGVRRHPRRRHVAGNQQLGAAAAGDRAFPGEHAVEHDEPECTVERRDDALVPRPGVHRRRGAREVAPQLRHDGRLAHGAR